MLVHVLRRRRAGLDRERMWVAAVSLRCEHLNNGYVSVGGVASAVACESGRG